MPLLRKNLKGPILTPSSKGGSTSGTLSEASPAAWPFCLRPPPPFCGQAGRGARGWHAARDRSGEEAEGPPQGPTLCAPCQGRPHLPPLWGPSALVWESWLPSSPAPTDTGPSFRPSLCPHGSPRTKMGWSIILLPKADPAFLLSPCLVASCSTAMTHALPEGPEGQRGTQWCPVKSLHPAAWAGGGAMLRGTCSCLRRQHSYCGGDRGASVMSTSASCVHPRTQQP